MSQIQAPPYGSRWVKARRRLVPLTLGAGLACELFNIAHWERTSVDSTHDDVLQALTVAVTLVALSAMSMAAVVLLIRHRGQQVTARSWLLPLAAAAIFIGAIAAIPVARDWNDGCNSHGGEVPLVIVPFIEIAKPSTTLVPVYRNTQTLKACPER